MTPRARRLLGEKRELDETYIATRSELNAGEQVTSRWRTALCSAPAPCATAEAIKAGFVKRVHRGMYGLLELGWEIPAQCKIASSNELPDIGDG